MLIFILTTRFIPNTKWIHNPKINFYIPVTGINSMIRFHGISQWDRLSKLQKAELTGCIITPIALLLIFLVIIPAINNSISNLTGTWTGTTDLGQTISFDLAYGKVHSMIVGPVGNCNSSETINFNGDDNSIYWDSFEMSFSISTFYGIISGTFKDSKLTGKINLPCNSNTPYSCTKNN